MHPLPPAKTASSSKSENETSPVWYKVLLTAVLGNVVEWYDHALYGILITFMAQVFFPSEDLHAALIATYAGLIVSYAVRPIGGVIMGRLSDLRGHRHTLVLTIALMTVGTIGIGILPGYAAIGIAAPILLMVCRMVQGIGASGEYTVAANFILEHGPHGRRQYLAGWSVGSTSLGPLLAAIVSLTLITQLSENAFNHWGWRIPFLLAAPLGLVTLYIRRSVPELPRIQKALAQQHAEAPPPRPFRNALREHWREMFQVIALGAGQRVGTFCIQTYFVATLIHSGFGAEKALLASILTYLIGPPAAIWGGILADRHGGRKVLLLGYGAFVLLTVPTFTILGGGSVMMATAAVVGFTFINNFVGSPLTHAYVLTFKPEVRGTAAALNFNVGTMLIGSTAPLIATWLHRNTGTDVSFGWYMTAICLLSLLIAAFAYPRAAHDA